MEKLKIFLSYSHNDKELACQFHEYLCKNGFEVIWDENTIVIGDDFNKKLKKALYEADIYMPIITERFEKSSFTQSEFLAAIGYNSARERPRLFPYIAYGNKIPFEFSSALCIMGTLEIEKDLEQIVIELNKMQGLIFAEQDTKYEITEQINLSLEEYLKDVFTKLEINERVNRILAYLCYILSVFFLLSITIFIIKNYNINPVALSTLSAAISVVKNVTVLSVLAALSRLTFILGKSFMVESIRNGDRIHAISFGKFFIQAFGNKATRQEIREVLGEWNIDKGSSFRTQDAKEIDPNFYGTLQLLKLYFEKK